MSRIRKAYEAQFRNLLRKAGARQEERGLAWLLNRAGVVASGSNCPLSVALTRVYDETSRKILRFRRGHVLVQRRFYCDSGLGGLARWLRAAGFQAFWKSRIEDDDLIQEARQLDATILTTDSMMMERRLLRDGVIPAFWLPPTLPLYRQVELVFHEFGLVLGPSRCMSCGGELRKEPKESLADRIPPRTYRWLDDYFVCGDCGRLFWHGSHWQRIRRQLLAAKCGVC
jgi:uncharacterized protein with PIN domain